MTNRIDGHARTVAQLLGGAKFTIDYFQREYSWKDRQARELVDDLTGKFLDFYEEGHDRGAVADYGHYFLGSVVISHKHGMKHIVDGQQRLTTLTLLLIVLHRLLEERESECNITGLIFSTKYGKRSFNLDVQDRAACMEKLFAGEELLDDSASESVQNIVARYRTLREYFPDEILERGALPYFVDWLCENVHLVEIEAYADEDAYTIFETMNDRGLSLSLPDMLKGYILANIRDEADQRRVNDLWKRHMQAFREAGEEHDVDFFKDWLRARHAETIRPGSKGAENKDYERIGSEFHRWVRDRHGDEVGIDLSSSSACARFVERDLDFYARQAHRICAASQTLTSGLESIRYNAERGLTLQTQVLLAPLDPNDSEAEVLIKLRLTADYLDIWLARRAWNSRTVAYSSIKYTLFTLTKAIRGLSTRSLSEYLREQLDNEPETLAKNQHLRLHQQNYRQIRHILARLSDWVDTETGLGSHFDELVSQGQGRPFEIEHLWPNLYERFQAHFSQESDFLRERGKLGGLVLLRRGHNQSLGDKPYEDKVDAYLSHGGTLLTQSMHPKAYEGHPSFRHLMERTGLAFKPHARFEPADQQERQELYLRIAEWVWNPSRLDLDGVKPPIHEALPEATEEDDEPDERDRPRAARYAIRHRFFTRLLEVANGKSELHRSISPSEYTWIGARREGQWWNYVVKASTTRAELYIDVHDAARNKALFDALHARKETIEAAFGAPLRWERQDDKRASRVCLEVPGGWMDERTWAGACERATDAMGRLYAAIAPHLRQVAGAAA